MKSHCVTEITEMERGECRRLAPGKCSMRVSAVAGHQATDGVTPTCTFHPDVGDAVLWP
jgi:hypothetical protein